MKAVFARAKADLLGSLPPSGGVISSGAGKYGNPRRVTGGGVCVIRRMKGLKRATVKKV
jgi:hypothetical protein